MEEPLNLTIKKKPVAIVAPSFDSNQNVKTVNYNKLIELCEKVEDGPQDLSLKKSEDIHDDKRNNNDKTMNYFNNNNDHEELRKYLFKNVNDEVRNNYNKNSFDLKTNIFKDVYKINDIYEKNFTSQQDSIYTMINHLAEHKFLTAWYMNSVLNMNLPYLNLNNSATTTTTSNSTTTTTNNNSILNNLLNKKSGDSKIDTIIKNDTNKSARSQVDQKNNVDVKNNQDNNSAADKKKPHIKKPLNAFMLYMKEMRAKVVAECTLKESAAINQILGRKWHALGREEQAKYYELARRERQLHMQLYPDWSSRANATRGKKRKRKQDPADGGNSMKKCRARYGLDQQSQWCKPCRRKKKCIRYMEAGDSADGNQSDDNLGSCGSMGDAHTPPEDDAESLNQSVSSPGGLSALSSLTSPGGVVLPSPSTSVASPSVSVASPYMLQSPLTPHEAAFDVKLVPPPPSQQQHQQLVQLHHHPPRNPVGTNPHDINNPLSVNQLTGQCVKNEPPDSSGNKDPTRSIISVT